MWKAYTVILILLVSLADAKILVSMPELKEIVERISGEEVESLIGSQIDPHSVSIGYQDLKKIEYAEVVLLANSRLLEFESKVMQVCGGKCLDFEDYNATLQDFPGIGENPHAYWLLPRNALNIALALKNKLVEMHPERVEEFEKNYQDLKKAIEFAEKDAKKIVSKVKDYSFVAMDPHVAYAVSALGLNVSLAFPEEFTPSAEELSRMGQLRNCVLVLVEYQEGTKLEEIAKQISEDYKCGMAKVRVISDLNFETLLIANAVSLSNPSFAESENNLPLYLLSSIAVTEALGIVVLWRSKRRT